MGARRFRQKKDSMRASVYERTGNILVNARSSMWLEQKFCAGKYGRCAWKGRRGQKFLRKVLEQAVSRYCVFPIILQVHAALGFMNRKYGE